MSKILLGISIVLCASSALALDLHDARVRTDANLSPVEKKAVSMLVEEVGKRTGLAWLVNGSAASGPIVTVHHATGSGPAEGFHLTVRGSAVEVQGNDDRGTLFGVGRLLRELRWDRGAAEVPSPLDIASSPK